MTYLQIAAANELMNALRNVHGIAWRIASLNPDVGCADHLGPFLGFLGNEFAETGGRKGKLSATFVGKPRLDFGISKSGGDFTVELVDNLGGRVARRPDAEPGTHLVARHEFAHGRDLGQHLRARGSVTASARSFPALTCSIELTGTLNITCTCPA